jgi:hypothetical protein
MHFLTVKRFICLFSFCFYSCFAFATCPTPVNLRESGRTFNSVWLSFNRVAEATGYRLEWKPASATTWTSVSLITTNADRIEYLLKPLAYGTTYNWRVQTICSETETSPFSGSQTFTMTCPEADSLRASVSPTAATLYWSAPAGLNQFTLRWRQTGSATWAVLPEITNPPYSLTGLAAGAVYEWQLTSHCADGTNATVTNPHVFTATCSPPIDTRHTNRTSSTIDLFWQHIPGTNIRYRVRFRPVTPGNNALWTEQPLTANRTMTLSDLQDQTTYEWQIQTLCDGQATAYGSGTTFTTNCDQPQSLWSYATYPIRQMQLSWEGISYASYTLQLRQQGQTDWTSINTTFNSYVLPQAPSSTIYQWRVQRICPNDVRSIFSPVNSFTTPALNCNLPYNNNEYIFLGRSTHVSWQTSDTKPSSIRWRAVGDTTWTTVDSLRTDGIMIGFSITEFMIPNLTIGQAYEWQTQMVCSQTEVSGFTPPRLFTATCGITPYQYEFRESADTYRLQWRAHPSVKYQIQWRQVSGGGSNWVSLPIVSNLNSTVDVPVRNLSFGTRYEWRIRTVCSATNSSVYTQPRPFMTDCSPPYSSIWAYSSAGVRIGWNTYVSPFALYRIRWRRAGTTQWTETPLINAGYYDLTPLQAGETYQYQIQTICDNQSGDYSETYEFIPVCVAPANLTLFAITSSSAAMTWQAIGLTSRYEVQWRSQGSGTWPNSQTMATASTSLTGLSSGTTYEWRVRTRCVDEELSSFTPSGLFTTLTCRLMYTVRAGAWTDPTLWSCNRIPSANDLVEINHVISIGDGRTGNAKQIRYGTGGRVNLGNNGRLQLSQ